MKETRNTALFFQLSQVITGITALPRELTSEYFDRVNTIYPVELKTLLTKFSKIRNSNNREEALKKSILEDPKTTNEEKNALKQIIFLWYTAQFTTPDKKTLPPETERQYQLQMMYHLIGAPTRGYSHHGYGYWAKDLKIRPKT